MHRQAGYITSMIRREPGRPRAEELLEGVSRTFALTIPQLPGGLREAVANAYLLCRIADTIEDDPGLDAETKDGFHAAFLEAAESGQGAADFAGELWPRLSPGTLDAEVDLIRCCPQVLQATRRLQPNQRRAILGCLSTMSRGMSRFERGRSLTGLEDINEFERLAAGHGKIIRRPRGRGRARIALRNDVQDRVAFVRVKGRQ